MYEYRTDIGSCGLNLYRKSLALQAIICYMNRHQDYLRLCAFHQRAIKMLRGESYLVNDKARAKDFTRAINDINEAIANPRYIAGSCIKGSCLEREVQVTYTQLWERITHNTEAHSKKGTRDDHK